jgi:hypothetical protein
MQDRTPPLNEIFLHRTAGPYIWVMSERTHTEHIWSELPPIADIRAGAAWRLAFPAPPSRCFDFGGFTSPPGMQGLHFSTPSFFTSGTTAMSD